MSHLMRTGAVGQPAAPDAADRGVSKRQWEKTVYRWRTELRNFAIPPVALQLNLPSATRQRPPIHGTEEPALRAEAFEQMLEDVASFD